MEETQKPSGVSVINVGLFKTGTASMAEAYRVLGLRPHHGLEVMDVPEHWVCLELAAEAKWPNVPGARGPQAAFTRADWDRIFGDYDAVTDIAAVFAEELIEAYPEAKVVIVERDVDKWFESFDRQILVPVWSVLGEFLNYFVLPLLGDRGLQATRKIVLGHWNSRNVHEVRANARDGYKAYYNRIRQIVPQDKRLEYKLGDGWEPLCKFLGKDIPDVSFPWVNDGQAHTQKQQEQVDKVIGKAWLVLKPWTVALCGMGVTGVAYYLAKGVL
ncbi:hypothetical protein HJFPF1_08302 [Paramyrothecium foliicola]|nr:hypothetical protein HJFPF1_08302 [Paramyrothecium foliicola]